MHRRQLNALGALTISAIAASALANDSLLAGEEEAKWGNLSATFVYDGQPPERRLIKIDKDAAPLREPIYDRRLVVDPQTKAIRYVCAWLLVEDGKVPAIHADFASAAKEPVVLKIDNLQFEPFISAVRMGQKLIFRGIDRTGHDPYVSSPENPEFGRLINPSPDTERVLAKPTRWPAQVQCSLHPWENARLIVQAHPYVGISDRAGLVAIKNLPVGTHTFVFWHESTGAISKVKRGNTQEAWESGRVTIDIKPGENELGEILIKPEPRR
ncbi:hypothetical protein ETAA8_07720 [Anatilimnocola aggregata]|uniref:Rhamnogalacturonan lyase domain-containing protein n=1 Tax=Anatilimnocola aggregata TaxID=2528021 RepID=A0A517Y6E4_9BACT|nr:hypothetical protein [Anatilimnocola aggregata]QDU25702.1 hypothetical protein ETAA8_07720 [Anatilimnocola aggregata]